MQQSLFIIAAICLFSGYPNSKIIAQKPALIKEIKLPSGFERIKTDTLSFQNYLQNLPLNTANNTIYSFDGSVISYGGYHCAIINFDIGTRNLQQCADAVMRIRAEYLYKMKRYNEIHFNFLSDGKPRYFNQFAKEDYSYKNFRKYLDYIYTYANTASLKAELVQIKNFSEIKAGDVLIQQGNPIGHAVIIVDMAINKKTGEKIVLIAQSYMPAQSIHVLSNQQNNDLNPWYSTIFNESLVLPTWTFYKKDLYRFK